MSDSVFDSPEYRGRGRPKGSPNKITRDIRAALRDLAEGNAHLVQTWLDAVAEKDPAEALRLWLSLLRYVTPTLQAAAIADLRPAGTVSDMRARALELTDDELLQIIASSPEGNAVIESRTNLPPHIPDPLMK